MHIHTVPTTALSHHGCGASVLENPTAPWLVGGATRTNTHGSTHIQSQSRLPNAQNDMCEHLCKLNMQICDAVHNKLCCWVWTSKRLAVLSMISTLGMEWNYISIYMGELPWQQGESLISIALHTICKETYDIYPTHSGDESKYCRVSHGDLHTFHSHTQHEHERRTLQYFWQGCWMAAGFPEKYCAM